MATVIKGADLALPRAHRPKVALGAMSEARCVGQA